MGNAGTKKTALSQGSRDGSTILAVPQTLPYVIGEVSIAEQPAKATALKTSPAFILSRVVPRLALVRDYRSLQHELNVSVARLQRLDMFRSVAFELDAPDPDNDPARVDVLLRIVEKGRAYHRVSAEVTSTGEQCGGYTVMLRNPFFGRADSIRASFSLVNDISRQSSISYSLPAVIATPAWQGDLEVGLSRQWINHSRFSSHLASVRGVNVALDIRQSEPHVHGSMSEEEARAVLSRTPVEHRVEWGGDWRDVVPSTQSDLYWFWQRNVNHPGPSTSVVGEGGASVKSFLKYSVVRDSRDSPLVPNRGALAKGSMELAGLGGDIKYVKVEGIAQKVIALAPWASFSLSVTGGLLKPIMKAGGTSILDRFFVGGPFTLRGFGPSSVGPRDGLDALGGDAFAGACAAMQFPFAQSSLLAGGLIHCFAGAGANVTGGMRGLCEAQAWRVGVGLGVVYPVAALGRLEVNVAHDVCSRPEDRTLRFQWGIGRSFW